MSVVWYKESLGNYRSVCTLQMFLFVVCIGHYLVEYCNCNLINILKAFWSYDRKVIYFSPPVYIIHSKCFVTAMRHLYLWQDFRLLILFWREIVFRAEYELLLKTFVEWFEKLFSYMLKGERLVLVVSTKGSWWLLEF